MTFARTVRLLAILVIVTGISAWRLSLFAQSAGNVRQYDPAFDGAPGALPASLDDADWGDIPAYVSAISGEARLDRDGEVTGDFEQVPLQIGDQIRTTRGRVEVLYDDGSVVALDEYSAVSVDAENTWRLHTGRMKVVSRAGSFAVDATPTGVARLRGSGDYRVILAVNRRNEPEVELAVTRGSAELENSLGRTLVRAGTRALTTASYAPSVPYAYVAPRDEFERWTESLEAERYSVTSTRYLPVELRSYGGYFDRDGYWSNHHTYGWVWYPRVAVGWEPFHSGRWSFVVGFGYNWIGRSRWEWPTYYYGRWDRYGSNWFWVPSRPVYFRRVGYSAPRTSAFVHVNYYSRPQPNRSSPSFRGNTDQRSRIVEAPRGDARRPSSGATTQDRVAIPRSSAVNRETFPTRSSTSPMRSPSDDRVFGSRPAPQTAPASPQERVAIPRSSSPNRETFPTRSSSPQATRPSDDRVFGSRPAPQSVRPEPQPGRSEVFGRRPSPSAQPAPPPQSAPPATAPSRPSSRGGSTSEARPSSSGSGGSAGRMSDPGRTSSPPPVGSRTPSSSSRPSSGTAVRRGGGG
jgi:hypothetical protein